MEQYLSYQEIIKKLESCLPEQETETRLLLIKALEHLESELSKAGLENFAKKVKEISSAIDLHWR